MGEPRRSNLVETEKYLRLVCNDIDTKFPEEISREKYADGWWRGEENFDGKTDGEIFLRDRKILRRLYSIN